MKRALAAFVFASFCAPAAAYDCFPVGLMPQLGLGTAWRTTTQPFGFAKAWWCLMPARTGDVSGKQYWQRQIFPVHNDDVDRVKFAAAAARVAAASDSVAQANAEVTAGQVTYAAGSRKQYEYAVLRYAACQDLRANPPPGVVFDPKPPGSTEPWVSEPAWCGAPPVPPTTPPTTAQYVVTGTAAYQAVLQTDGTLRRLTAVWPVAPIRGEEATEPFLSFNVRFCKVPRLSTAQTVVAGCAVKP